jgi:hypothetical protein
MISILRVFSISIGFALLALPPFMVFAFAASLGELDEMHGGAFLEPLAVGLLFGSGPIAAGLPYFLAGTRKPKFRLTAGILLCISSIALLLTSFIFPLLLAAVAFNALLFLVFVWPARELAIANLPLRQGDSCQPACKIDKP